MEKGIYRHSISISELLRLFRQFGRHDIGQNGKLDDDEEETEAALLWLSLGRLVQTKVEWHDAEYKGISALVASVLMSKQHRQSGWVHFSFGELLAHNLLLPRIFARLRPHFMLRLRGKYAVTLYEILEAYVNRRDSTCTVSLAELQNWLKVPEGAYPDWRELKKRVIEPAVREINEHADEGGFFVAYEGIREGQAFVKIKFSVTKCADRFERDETLQRSAARKRRFKIASEGLPADQAYEPSEYVLDQARAIAPGFDLQVLTEKFNSYRRGKNEMTKNPPGAFLRWLKRFSENHKAA
jgi:Initiator Replication protein